jgi:hypothetical protein
MIPDEIMLTIPEEKNYITKPELFMLDLLSNYQWDRPLSVLNMGGDLKVGIKDYLMYDGYSYRFTPIRNQISSTDPGIVDADELYGRMKDLYKWDALKRDDYFVDYQNMYTFLGVLSQRQLFVTTARALLGEGENEKAMEMLDLCQERFPESNFPLESIPLGFSGNDYMVAQMVEFYYYLGATDKARSLARRMCDALQETAAFYLDWGDLGSSEFETAGRVLLYIADIMKDYGDQELANALLDRFDSLLKGVTGSYDLELGDDTLTIGK